MNRVAVIGGGLAGMNAARHLARVGITPVVFEQRNCIGGQWAYEAVDPFNLKDVFSSMYENLRTNQSTQVMTFPGFSYPKNVPSYAHRSTVYDYLLDYARNYDISKYVHFNTRIQSVTPNFNSDGSFNRRKEYVKWNISFENDERLYEDIFDGVIVANGHYSKASYPVIHGIENFKGVSLHSHYYRRAADFKNKTVLILGCGPSSLDILLELADTCEKVYVCHRGKPIISELPDNVHEHPNIKYISNDGRFILEDGTSLQADVFMPCTGYDYDFPFLDKSTGISTNKRVVFNLYKHLVNITYPSMMLIGLPWPIATFPFVDRQSEYMAKVFTGQINLPNQNEMKIDTQQEIMEREKMKEESRFFHRLDLLQFPYLKLLGDIAEAKPHLSVIEKLYAFNLIVRAENLQGYRELNYRIINNDEFEIVGHKLADFA